ncbi:tetratricopeptide repeat protein [Reichenbachiella sp. MSK19-1]|uniref:tetratricopeptide repeat protein n=1 Tax=Reichenbachiella sp. MSK19-1 TaxID=1897631 RepID=UPI001314A9CD|nr:DUF2225 domain-containing protein [Reichenbachiella sp. MSK19-1]
MRRRYIGWMTGCIVLLAVSSSTAQDTVIDEDDYNSNQQHTSNGWDLIGQEQFEDALSQFNLAIDSYDGNADSFVGRANALLRIDRFSEAQKDIETALLLAPDQADMFYLAGNIYFKMEYFELAARNYSSAIRANDTSDIPVDLINCYYNRGNAYFSAGMYRSAINDFSRVIDANEDSFIAYHNRALAYKNREEYDMACQDFYKAQELGSKMSQKYIDRYCP